MNDPTIEINVDDETVMTLTPPVLFGYERVDDAVLLQLRTIVHAHLAQRADIRLSVRLTHADLQAVAAELGMRLVSAEDIE